MGYDLLDDGCNGLPHISHVTYGKLSLSQTVSAFADKTQVGAAYLAGARWTPLIDAAKEYFGESSAKAIPSPLPTGGHGEL